MSHSVRSTSSSSKSGTQAQNKHVDFKTISKFNKDVHDDVPHFKGQYGDSSKENDSESLNNTSTNIISKIMSKDSLNGNENAKQSKDNRLRKTPMLLKRTLSSLSTNALNFENSSKEILSKSNDHHETGSKSLFHTPKNTQSYTHSHHSDIVPPRKLSLAGSLLKRFSSSSSHSNKGPKSFLKKNVNNDEITSETQSETPSALNSRASSIRGQRRDSQDSNNPLNTGVSNTSVEKVLQDSVSKKLEEQKNAKGEILRSRTSSTSKDIPRRRSVIIPSVTKPATSVDRRGSTASVSVIPFSQQNTPDRKKESFIPKELHMSKIDTCMEPDNKDDVDSTNSILDDEDKSKKLDILYDKEHNKPTLFPLDMNFTDLTDITKTALPSKLDDKNIAPPEHFAHSSDNVKDLKKSSSGISRDLSDTKFRSFGKKSHSVADIQLWATSISNISPFTSRKSSEWVAPESWDVESDKEKLKAKKREKARKRRMKQKKKFSGDEQLSINVKDRRHLGKNNATEQHLPNTTSKVDDDTTDNLERARYMRNEIEFSDSLSSNDSLSTLTNSSQSLSSSEEDEDFYDIQVASKTNESQSTRDLSSRALSSVNLLSLKKQTFPLKFKKVDDERSDKVEYELERYYKDFSDLDPKRHYAIRIFNTDDTFTTLSCTPSTTVEEMIPTLKKKFNISAQTNYQISLKVGKLSKILRPLAKPILVERKLLLLNGYRKSDPLYIIGVEDLSFVFKFLFHPVSASHFTPEQEQRLLRSDFVHVDLRNMNLTTPLIIFYQHTSEIESLDVSNNANIFLPLEFIESAIKLLSLRIVNVRASKFPINITEAYKLVSLELQRNFIKKVPSSISRLGNLTILNLQCNELDKLPRSFSQLQNLQLLDISSNRFSDYPKVINSCTNLLQVDLSYNKIQYLPESINKLVKLAKINLSHNKLDQINSLSDMKNLRTLNLRFNRISSIKTNASNLQNLFLTDNRISNYEDNVPKLRTLEMQENPITIISFKDFYPTNMTFLSLNKAQLASIPGMLFTKLSRLEKLELNENNLTRLPSEIGLLSKLVYLSVSRNKLESLPQEFSQLKSLRSLDVHSNNIRNFFDGMEDIELNSLNISSNMFGTVDLDRKFIHNISNGSKLSKSLLFFVAADNQFNNEMLSLFNCFVNLKLLNLSYNNISNVLDLKLENLMELYLSGNRLNALPSDTVVKWKQLKTLMVNGNQLLSLPAELSLLQQLDTFDVGSNQLKYNISNFHYDWNWRNNKALKYLNFSGNKRFEIKTFFNSEIGADMSDLTVLPQLKELGLMDVTINTSRVPDETSNFRLRTTASVINGMRYGVADTLGQRDYISSKDVTFERFRGNDDECLLCLHDIKNQNADHGHNISRIVRDIYDKILIRQLEKYGDTEDDEIKKALRFSFLQLNKEINSMLSSVDSGANVENLTSADLLSGACSTVIFIKGKKLFCANIGDCMAILSKNNGDSLLLTKLHVPSKSEEYQRIRISGGYVNNGKLDGVVDVSRAVGFFDLLPHIHASPDISVVNLTRTDEMLVVATQNLWDCMSYETACDIARENVANPMLAAEEMKDHAIAYGCSENITILCLALYDTSEQQNRFTLNKNSLVTRRTTFEDTTLRRLQPEIAPPTGNLAVVFTDIKNSTFLWELFPDAMRTSIKTHNDIMRRQLRIFGGYEVKTEGDAFMVTFPTPIGALIWCLSVQLKLLDTQWPEEITSIQDGGLIKDDDGIKIYQGLSVRMGIHWGAPVPELDLVTQRMDYLGPIVNKAARVSGIADGGQITLSSDFVSEFNKIMKFHKSVKFEMKALIDVYGEEIIGEVLEREIAILENIGWVFFDYGEQKLKGLETKEFITIAYPKILESRHEFVTPDNEYKTIDQDILFRMRAISNKLEGILSIVSNGYFDFYVQHQNSLFITLDQKSQSSIMQSINEKDTTMFLDHLTTRIESVVALLQLRQRMANGLDTHPNSEKNVPATPIFELIDKLIESYEAVNKKDN